MRCRQFESLLTDYIDERLTGSLMLEMREHAEHCISCRKEFDDMRTVRDLLRSMSRHNASPHYNRNLTSRSTGGWFLLICDNITDRPQRGRQAATAFGIAAFALLAGTVSFAPQSTDSVLNSYFIQQSVMGSAYANTALPIAPSASSDVTMQLAGATSNPVDVSRWRIIQFRIHRNVERSWVGISPPPVPGPDRNNAQGCSSVFASFCGH